MTTNQIKTQIGLVALLACAALNSACSVDTVDSTKVQPSAIYQDYVASYYEDNQTTIVDATYRVGGPTGTTVLLVAPSRLTVNGLDVQPSQFFGTHYELSLSSGFNPDNQIVWYDQTGKSYSNLLSIRPIYFQNTPPTSAPLGNSFVIPVTAPNFDSNDQLSAIITQRDQNGELIFASTSKYNGSALVFSQQDLQPLKAGAATLQIERSRWISLQNVTGQGGSASAIYNSATLQINLTNLVQQVTRNP